MMSEPHVRHAQPEDWQHILPLLKRKIDSEQEVKRRFEDFIRRSDHYLPVAFIDARLVGYGWVQNYGAHLRAGFQTARLHDLFVHPEYQKQGVGAALFNSCKEWAQQTGVRYLEWQANQSSLGFYQRLGYIGDPCPQPDYPFFEIDFHS
ncbi:GNAT family N-acetyltransferase [Ktedonobacter racemifer]|uniref:GCN5-related N-acetyltransferase n=1 Tax=Ktedonobacter racemifer DSM 44963 TaxID=485913 RepID=D6TBE3_KTERA|nr:GNAT family N-acetyltransferase [Ktedonobacter racemifer]EFH87927.1 GCN5-related N-acetyltransferase [Ktedonobacter racemifer DSM 44963]